MLSGAEIRVRIICGKQTVCAHRAGILDGFGFTVYLCNRTIRPGEPPNRNFCGKSSENAQKKRRKTGCRRCFNDFLTDAERHTERPAGINPGLIILRAYTKMYAVPGVRFGWCMTGTRR